MLNTETEKLLAYIAKEQISDATYDTSFGYLSNTQIDERIKWEISFSTSFCDYRNLWYEVKLSSSKDEQLVLTTVRCVTEIPKGFQCTLKGSFFSFAACLWIK